MTAARGPRRSPALGRSHRTAISCEDARLAVSTLHDGERAQVPGAAACAHLATCEACRCFEAGVVALARQACLRTPKPVPDGLAPLLAPLLRDTIRPSSPGWQARQARRRSLRRIFRWGVAVVPAVFAVAAFPLAASAHPHHVPAASSHCARGLPADDALHVR